MEPVKVALLVSITARAVAAVSGLLALPVYLSFLGVEAYGVVGLFASLQAVVAFMDFGLATTLTRQLAATGGDAAAMRQARDTTLTFECAYLVLSLVVGLVLTAVAPWVASTWVNPSGLSVDGVTWSLELAALALACAWPANLYCAGMAGQHRQVPLAISNGVFALLRVGLSVLFIWHRPSLDSFFWAQLVVSILQSVATRFQLWQGLAMQDHRARVRWRVLSGARRFAGGMTAITITSILLAQSDKLILSHVLALSEFGIYAVAGTLATGLYVLISPLFSVLYPRLSSVWSSADTRALAELYHSGSQTMAVLVMPMAAVLVCFAAPSLYVLTNNAVVSHDAALILVFLTLGAALNGVMNMPYALQLAAGWTSLSVITNLVAVCLITPLTWWAAVRHGAVGGAAAWSLLNAAHLLVTPPLLHRRLLKAEKWRWYVQDVLLPAAVSLSVAALLATIWPAGLASRWSTAMQLAACWLLVTAATVASVPAMRRALPRFSWR